MRRRKKRHRTVRSADPDLRRACVEIEGAFFVDLGLGIAWGKDFDADFWSAGEKNRIFINLAPPVSQPGNIGSVDSIGGRNGALSESDALRQQLCEESRDPGLTAGVTSSRRWTHDDTSVSIGFDTIREFCQATICQDLRPARNVKRVLQLEIWELNRNSHARKVRQKWKKCSSHVTGLWVRLEKRLEERLEIELSAKQRLF